MERDLGLGSPSYRAITDVPEKESPQSALDPDSYRRSTIMSPKERPSQMGGYSQFVSFMKILLPLVAALLIFLVVIWPHIQPDGTRFYLGFSLLNAKQSDDPSMVNARYLGADSERRPYSITADYVRNNSKETIRVELEMPKADIALDDGTWLVLTANSGVYHRQQSTLDLEGAVNLFHDTGYEINTTKAKIDLNNGKASGTSPVKGQGPFGELEAEGFRLIDRGKVIYFTGKAKLTLFPRADGAK
ncbi:MAG: LPS export ABC transporter periplasmic protein LptC [Rhodospirillales bacterium]|nr:LPS export ABC transporter periplasmic protein LptC [Rhodospirillales bacterium]